MPTTILTMGPTLMMGMTMLIMTMTIKVVHVVLMMIMKSAEQAPHEEAAKGL